MPWMTFMTCSERAHRFQTLREHAAGINCLWHSGFSATDFQRFMASPTIFSPCKVQVPAWRLAKATARDDQRSQATADTDGRQARGTSSEDREASHQFLAIQSCQPSPPIHRLEPKSTSYLPNAADGRRWSVSQSAADRSSVDVRNHLTNLRDVRLGML